MSEDLNTKIKKVYSKEIESKRYTRFFTVQFMYAYFMQKLPATQLNQLLYEFLHNMPLIAEVNQKYAASIATGVVSHQDELKEKIQQFLAEDWRFGRLGKVVQSILLVATYEILFTENLPSPIIINEYLEVAKMLNHDGEVGFINSVLDGIFKQKESNG